MKDISHANPYTGETAGQLFNRGPIVIADGGEANSVEPGETPVEAATTASNDEDTMKTVSHTPPNDCAGVNRAFERGRRDQQADGVHGTVDK